MNICTFAYVCNVRISIRSASLFSVLYIFLFFVYSFVLICMFVYKYVYMHVYIRSTVCSYTRACFIICEDICIVCVPGSIVCTYAVYAICKMKNKREIFEVMGKVGVQAGRVTNISNFRTPNIHYRSI